MCVCVRVCGGMRACVAVYLEKTMFPLPLNCKTHNGLLNCLNLLDYSENVIPDET